MLILLLPVVTQIDTREANGPESQENRPPTAGMDPNDDQHMAEWRQASYHGTNHIRRRILKGAVVYSMFWNMLSAGPEGGGDTGASSPPPPPTGPCRTDRNHPYLLIH